MKLDTSIRYFFARHVSELFYILYHQEHSNTNKLRRNKPTSFTKQRRRKKSSKNGKLDKCSTVIPYILQKYSPRGKTLASKKNIAITKRGKELLNLGRGDVRTKWVLMEHPRRDNDARRRPASICSRTQKGRSSLRFFYSLRFSCFLRVASKFDVENVC